MFCYSIEVIHIATLSYSLFCLYTAAASFRTFVDNGRMGGGIWRRGGETPSAVKWEDRITEIREGSWSYVASSIGRAPGMCTNLTLS